MKIKSVILILALLGTSAFVAFSQNTKQILIPFQSPDNKLYGYKDSISGTEVLKPQYLGAAPFVNGMAEVVSGDLKAFQEGKVAYLEFAFINPAGKQICMVQCQDMRYFSQGRAAVMKDGKWGFSDTTGKLIIEPIYENVGDFFGGLAVIVNGSKCGLIDRAGKEIIPCSYDYMDMLTFKFILAFNGTLDQNGFPKQGKYGVLDKTGKIVLPLQYDQLAVKSGFIFMLMNQKCGVADTLTGKIIAPCEMEFIPEFKEGIASYAKAGKYGYLKEGGKILVEPIYKYAGGFSGGIARVSQAEKDGFVNKAGVLFIPCTYDYCEGPFDSLWMVTKAGKSGYVSAKGLIVPCVYDWALYKDGYITVQKGGKQGLYHKNGKVMLECIYDEISEFISKYGYGSSLDAIARVKKAGKYGVVNDKGKVVVPTLYDAVEIKYFYSSDYPFVKVKQGELWGIVNLKGEFVTPCIYEGIYAFQSGMCKVLTTRDDKPVAGFIDKSGELVYSGPESYMVKDYYVGDFVEYNYASQTLRIDKKGKCYKKEGNEWVEIVKHFDK